MVRSKMALGLVCAAGLAAGLAGQARAELVAGTTFQNFLVTWDSAAPQDILSGVAIDGLATNEVILGLDFRNGTANQLYALGSFGRLYTINMTTGQATRVGSTAFSPSLNGSNFGFGFQPDGTTLRVTSNADQNLRINSQTGTVIAADGNIRPVAGDEGSTTSPNIVHLAYNSSTFFGIDTGRDRLVTMDDPNSGLMRTIGALGFDATELGGFDWSPGSNTAYAGFINTDSSRTLFGTINLTTGAFTAVGEVGGGAFLTTLTVVPAPGALALAGLGLIALRRRR